jgi:spore germination cell wall hydrolase CwlJ-like protein
MAPRLDYSPDDLITLARTLYGEARGEGEAGRIAVAWVVRNRLKRPKRFRATIREICQQPWQFSCWNASDPNRAKILAASSADPVFADCIEVARRVLDDEADDPTHGADFYCVSSLTPNWARGHQPCAKIGRHSFYNDVD